ncbi:L,D-transpeptidase family protein [Parathalassolituus penaei]|uniref:L,D-transpeptidase family protein n=1 Tax=Parathalassolituus penaei TaxID=2997323 RepID=A0A9X3EDH3_9GAMM|nr:L,D-transpeptidase family protein [Parathalassolituus penaei]MCY0965190.1 L,D-transpeptidase family protein [Parathalassolituus penaei]
MNTANVLLHDRRITVRRALSPGFRLPLLAALLWLNSASSLAASGMPAAIADEAPLPVVSTLVANPEVAEQPATNAVSQLIQRWMTIDQTPDPANELYRIYSTSQFQPLWLDNTTLGVDGQRLLTALDETAADGWLNYPFELERIHTLQKQLAEPPMESGAQPSGLAADATQHAAELELYLTRAALAYARMVDQYQLLPDIQETDQGEAVRAALQRRSPPRDSLVALLDAIRYGQLSAWLQELTPETPAYQALRGQWQHYRQLAERGDWTPIPTDWSAEPGSQHPLLPLVRQRLLDYGDLSADDNASSVDPTLLDATLEAALHHYQQRYKLSSTGGVGPRTLQYLNEPPAYLARKIAFNMKRQRFMPAVPDDRFILVNAADFRLQLFEYGLETLSMKVIVGKPARRTPVMTQALTQLELAPTWTVPDRIAREYLLPKFRKDPTQIQRNQYQISDRYDPALVVDPATIDWNSVKSKPFPYRIVQAPGRMNALGQVKFLFPNTQSIYLHDTSQPELFRKDMRALSFGCIRLEKPLALTEHLLAGTRNWDMERVQSTIADHRKTRLNLAEPVPLYLMYWTAWVDEKGQLQLRDDIYRRDQNAGIRVPTGSELHAAL